ncbi:uncharacterized protein FFB14_15140 [Fusarium fujikuroi]|nr:uncharacterized protein FFB14_15140 [Fusarium fujikuroi]
MRKRLKQDICGIGKLDATPEDVGKDTLTHYLPAELEYACIYWAYHLEASGRPNDKVYGFLLDHFLHWLEALSILKRLPHGLKVLQNLTDLVKSSDTTSNLMGFLDDGRRAALRVASIIESAPLQAYASLLFFSPLTCRIRQQFWAERLPASLHVEGIKSGWDGHFQTLKLPEIVDALSFSPDGRFLASASDADDVRIWNASTGTHLMSLEAESQPCTAVVFSPNSQYLAVGYDDRRVRIWDLTTWTYTQTDRCPGYWITAIMLSSDGRLLSATSDGKVLFWHAKTGTLISMIHCVKVNDTLMSATFSSNLQFVAWATGGVIELWNLDAGTIRHIIPVDSFSKPMAFSPNNEFFVCISYRGLQIWNTTTGELEYTLEDWDLDDEPISIAFSFDGQLLASGSSSKISLWNLVTRDPHDLLINSSAEISAFTFSPDSEMIAAGLNNGEIQIWATAYTGRKSPDYGSAGRHLVLLSPNHQWVVSRPLGSSCRDTLGLFDVSTGKLQRTVKSTGSFNHVQFSPNSEYLAWKSSSSDGFIWNLEDGTKQEILNPDAKRLASHIAYSPSGKLAVICWKYSTIELHDAISGSYKYSLPEQDIRIQSIAFSPDSNILALKTEGKIQLWNVETKEMQDELQVPRLYGAYPRMVFSPSGKKLALQRSSNVVWFDTKTRDYESSPKLSGFVSEFAFTSDFLLLAVASTDEPHTNSIKIHLHDIERESLQGTLHGHQGYVMRLDFLPDSRILAVASEDRTVRLWDVTTHSQLHTFNTYNAVPRMMRFSDNGHIIAVESIDRTIRLWNTKTGRFLQMIQYNKGFLHEMAISSEALIISVSDVSYDGFWDPWKTLSYKLHVYHYPILNDDHTVTHDPGFCGTNLSADGSWLMKDSEKILWIPPEYRPEEVYQHSDTCDLCDASQEVKRSRRKTADPKIHYGVIASGNALVKNASMRDRILDAVGEQCMCVEMEAAGLMDRFPCLVIRGICDYADSHKNDRWQNYASATAATFAVELLSFVPVRQLETTQQVVDVLRSVQEGIQTIQTTTKDTEHKVYSLQ